MRIILHNRKIKRLSSFKKSILSILSLLWWRYCNGNNKQLVCTSTLLLKMYSKAPRKGSESDQNDNLFVTTQDSIPTLYQFFQASVIVLVITKSLSISLPRVSPISPIIKLENFLDTYFGLALRVFIYLETIIPNHLITFWFQELPIIIEKMSVYFPRSKSHLRFVRMTQISIV